MGIVAIVGNVTSVTNKDDKVGRIESDSTQDVMQTGGFSSDSQAVGCTLYMYRHYALCQLWLDKNGAASVQYVADS